MPVFAHLEGICHVYIHAAADLAMAEKIVVNAKMRRTSICGAAETLLVDKAVVATHLKPIVEALQKAGCEIRGDETTRAMVKGVKAAVESDYGCEFLDAIIAVRVVDGLDAAIAHIERYGSHHTDSIVTGDPAAAEHSCARSIRRSSCTTPRPSSPTGASSAWVPRSALPPAACTPAAGRRRAADQLQVPRARFRAGPPLSQTVADRFERHAQPSLPAGGFRATGVLISFCLSQRERASQLGERSEP